MEKVCSTSSGRYSELAMSSNVQFKFRPDASSDERNELIAKLEGSGADAVEPLFPNSQDDELASLYSAHVEQDRDFSKLMRLLKRSRKVDFVEPTVDRRLLLPIELRARNGSHR
jgi:hypothetical protein